MAPHRIPYEELKGMVLQLKVSDLQELLAFAGQNKSGKKSELQTRAMDLIRYHKSSALEGKISYLYLRIINQSVQDDDKLKTEPPDAFYNRGNHLPSINDIGLYMNHPIEQPYILPNETQMTRMSAFHDYSNMVNAFTAPHNSYYYSYANITFKQLPFYELIADIIKPTTLTSRHAGATCDFHLRFHVTSHQLSKILESKVTVRDKSEYLTIIQVRFCKLNPDMTEPDDELPLQLHMRVNDKSCVLPPPIPSTNRPGIQLRRMNFPINITGQVSFSSSVSNTIYINWAPEYNKVHAVAVQLVHKLTSNHLINNLQKKGVQLKIRTEELIRDKLGAESDAEIAATSLKVSMACPLGKIRMTIPCRALTCNHIQCFDATLYVQMNEMKPCWLCPVCNKPCPYDNLIVDGYFLEILNNSMFKEDSDDVQLNSDGTWVQLPPKKPIDHTTAETTRKRKLSVDLSDAIDSTTYQVDDHDSSNNGDHTSSTIKTIDSSDDSCSSSMSSPPPSSSPLSYSSSASSSSLLPYRSSSRPLNLSKKKKKTRKKHNIKSKKLSSSSQVKKEKLPPPLIDLTNSSDSDEEIRAISEKIKRKGRRHTRSSKPIITVDNSPRLLSPEVPSAVNSISPSHNSEESTEPTNMHIGAPMSMDEELLAYFRSCEYNAPCVPPPVYDVIDSSDENL